jgi:uncharacterized protein YndB with AHSA1/START domain
VTVRWSPFEASELEIAAFTDPAAQGGMQQGWSGTLSNLEEYLAKL